MPFTKKQTKCTDALWLSNDLKANCTYDLQQRTEIDPQFCDHVLNLEFAGF